MMKGYAGRIKNGGTIIAKAPFASGKSGKGTQKITGNDLRTGGGKKGR